MYGKGFTGIGRYIQELLNHLSKIDKKNEYLILLTKENIDEFNIQQDNFKTKIVDFSHYSISEQTKFLKYLNNLDVDLVHFPHFNLPTFYKKPFVTTIHDLIHTLFPGKKKGRFFHRKAYDFTIKQAVKNSRKVIAVSKNTKDDIIKLLKTDPEKIEVTYEAVDPEYRLISDPLKITDLKSKYGITKPFLLYIGNWRYHKNVHGLIQAFNLIKQKHKVDCQLVITGKKGKIEQEEAEQAMEVSPFKSDIILPGFVPENELPLFYNAATLFAFPSFYEGFGLPPLEAMACGTPVVSSNTACMPEIQGAAAEYFDPNNVKQMAGQFTKVLKDTDLQKEMSKKGLEHVRQYNWQRMAKETLEIYRKAV